MTPARVVIVLLLLVAALFAAGVVSSATSEDDPKSGSDEAPPWTESLGELFSVDGPPGSKVPAREVQVDPSSVRQEPAVLALQSGQSCVLTVRPDPSTDFRSLKLRVTAGKVRVTMKIEGEEKAETYSTGEKISIAIRKRGDSLRLASAVAASPATVAID